MTSCSIADFLHIIKCAIGDSELKSEDLDKYQVYIERDDLTRVPIWDVHIRLPFEENFNNDGVLLIREDYEV